MSDSRIAHALCTHGIPGDKEEASQAAATAPGPSPCMCSCRPPTSDDEEGPRSVQKPYIITKSRESWTNPEHDKFLKALQLDE